MPEIVKPKTPLPVRCDHAGFDGSWSEVFLYHDGRRQRFFAPEPYAGKNIIVVFRITRPLAPGEHEPRQQRMHGNRSLRSFRLRNFEPSPYISATNIHDRLFEIQIHPHQSKQFRHPQCRGSIAQGERTPWLWNVEKDLERLL